MPEEALNHTRAVQQAISTTVTCKTLIKYNSNLSNEQKEEILSEIETTLTFLGKRLEIEVSHEVDSLLAPEELGDLLITSTGVEGAVNGARLEAQQSLTHSDEHEISLHHLHQLYRAYLSDEPGKGIADLEARYKTVMGSLDQLQAMTELRHDATASDLTIDGLLSRVRGFMTALYCMFREFAALFAKAVEGQSIDIDTEAMVLLQEYPHEAAQELMRDITPLMRVYNKQHQLQQYRGSLHENARDTTAFLIFLQESLEQTFSRRQEIVAQIKSTASLLNELIALLTDYELAVMHIMQSPSRSR